MSSRPRVDLESIRIPSLPEVVARLQALLLDPDTGLAEVGAIVATDPPLAARVLRTANSAAYGLREPVQTLPRAATVLGLRVLRDVVVQVCLVRAYEHLAEDERLDLERLWNHSITAAVLAQDLGMRAQTRLIEPHDAYTCALLHDLGKLVLFESHRDAYAEVIRAAGSTGTGTYPFERDLLGITHPEVGAMLARAWKLPDEIVRSIRLHHAAPRELLLAPMAALVSLADRLALALEEELPHQELWRHPACRLLRIDPHALDQAAERGREVWASGLV